MADIKRDFNADRTTCDAATVAPWTVCSPTSHGTITDDNDGTIVWGPYECNDDARFIAEARTGWPAALEHIRTLEDETRRCDDEIERLRRILDVQVGITSDFLEENERLRVENAALLECVEWYGERKNYTRDDTGFRPAAWDSGQLARECIAKLGGGLE